MVVQSNSFPSSTETVGKWFILEDFFPGRDYTHALVGLAGDRSLGERIPDSLAVRNHSPEKIWKCPARGIRAVGKGRQSPVL